MKVGHPDTEVLQQRVVKRGTQGQVTLPGCVNYTGHVLDVELCHGVREWN